MKGANYMVVKKMVGRHMRYYIYKRSFFGFFWKNIGCELSVEDAERVINSDKKSAANKKIGPEIVGWYK